MPVWLSFIYRGARVGGLREYNSLAREMGYVLFQPDSKTGQEEEAFKKERKLEKHFRHVIFLNINIFSTIWMLGENVLFTELFAMYIFNLFIL